MYKLVKVSEIKCVFLHLKRFQLCPFDRIFPKRLFSVVSMGESAQLAPSSGFYVGSSAILSCKSFKIGGDF